MVVASYPNPGEVLKDAYRIGPPIARGGGGCVFEGEQLSIGREVAIKVLAPRFLTDALLLQRFEQEALLSNVLKHPHIIELYDYGTTPEGLPFIVMERLNGQTIRGRLGDLGGGMSLRETLQIARQLLQGLAAAHDAGVLHRDLKPTNIFLCAFSHAPRFVKILDFGIAKIRYGLAKDAAGLHPAADPDVDSPLDTSAFGGDAVGSPRYMSPEQLRRKPLTFASDLFSVGLVISEMIEGVPLVTGKQSVDVLARILTSKEFRLPEVVRASPLADIVARCVRKAPEARYQSCAEVLDAIDRLENDLFAAFGTGSSPKPQPEEEAAISISMRFDEADLPGDDAPLTPAEPDAPDAAPSDAADVAAAPDPPAPAQRATPEAAATQRVDPASFDETRRLRVEASEPAPRSGLSANVVIVAAVVIVGILAAGGIWLATRDGGAPEGASAPKTVQKVDNAKTTTGDDGSPSKPTPDPDAREAAKRDAPATPGETSGGAVPKPDDAAEASDTPDAGSDDAASGGLAEKALKTSDAGAFRLRVTTTPEGAEVRVGTLSLGTTPLDVDLGATPALRRALERGRTLKARVIKPGYAPETLELPPDVALTFGPFDLAPGAGAKPRPPRAPNAAP